MTGARAAVAVVTGVSVLALGACTGSEAEPRFAPSPSAPAGSSGTPTQAPGPVEPTMPAAARGTDAAAAEAFVRFYWEMVNYAQATGDLDGLQHLGAKNCGPCRAGLSYLEKVHARGGRVAGGNGTVAGLHANFVHEGQRESVVVEFQLSTTRQTVRYPGPRQDEVYPAGTVPVRAVLVHAGDRWRMTYWGKQ